MRTVRSGRRSGAQLRSTPKEIGAAIQELVGSIGIGKTLKQYEVVTLWPTLVGEQIARVTTAKRMENGVLLIEVSNAPWRAELTMRRGEIARKINVSVGKNVVKEIRFR